MTPAIFGAAAEVNFAARAIEEGLNPHLPLQHSLPWDCMVDHPERALKVQVKSSSRVLRDFGAYRPGDFDIIVCWDTDRVFRFFPPWVRYIRISSSPSRRTKYQHLVENWGLLKQPLKNNLPDFGLPIPDDFLPSEPKLCTNQATDNSGASR